MRGPARWEVPPQPAGEGVAVDGAPRAEQDRQEQARLRAQHPDAEGRPGLPNGETAETGQPERGSQPRQVDLRRQEVRRGLGRRVRGGRGGARLQQAGRGDPPGATERAALGVAGMAAAVGSGPAAPASTSGSPARASGQRISG